MEAAGTPSGSWETGVQPMKFEVELEGVSGKTNRVVELQREGDRYRIWIDGKEVNGDALQVSKYTFSILLNGRSFEVHVAPAAEGRLKLQTGPS